MVFNVGSEEVRRTFKLNYNARALHMNIRRKRGIAQLFRRLRQDVSMHLLPQTRYTI